MQSLPALVARVHAASGTREIARVVQQAASAGWFSPDVADAALTRLLQPAQAATAPSSDSVADTPAAAQPPPEPAVDDESERLDAVQSILDTMFAKPGLVYTPTAWRAATRLAQRRQPPSAVLDVHAAYTRHRDLVPTQNMTTVHVAALHAVAAAQRPVSAVTRTLELALGASASPGYRAAVHGAAIAALVKLKDVDGAWTAFQRAAAAEGLVLHRGALAALLQAVVQRHQRARFDSLAAHIAEHFVGVKPDVPLANQFVRGHARFDGLDAAVRFVTVTFPAWDLHPDGATYAFLVQAALDAGDPDRARQMLADLRERNLPVGWQAYRPLLAAAARRGDLDGVNRIVEQLRAGDAGDVQRDLPRIADVIVAELVGAGHVAAADLFLGALPDDARSVGVYNAYIRGLVSSRVSGSVDAEADDRMARALRVFERVMPAAGIAPDAVTFNTLVSAFAQRREYARAIALLKAAPTVTAASFNPLLLAAARDRDPVVFGLVEREMAARSVPLDAIGLDAKLECLARAGELATALAVLESQPAGYRPSLKAHMVIFESLVDLARPRSAPAAADGTPKSKRTAKAARTDPALVPVIDELAARLEVEPDHSRASLAAFLDALLRLGRARDVVRVYLAHADRVPVNSAIANTVLRAARASRSPATAQSLVAQWTDRDRFALQPQHYAQYLETLAAAGWVDQAVAVLDAMPNPPEPTHLRSVVAPFRAAGRYDAADRLAAHLVQRFPSMAAGEDEGFARRPRR
ncbi:hypothetical protein H9P43_007582 [Blastocladiella emersonii ATCC 22665]|nr:hypothetical protein H9P43_007559 [Blastocladiella emersonii ATCC 22665]KAI9168210.1 hypothetical protein H9P43_007582 [Blastocladiella emersonii ATCC 22665]